jgi:hypothetical protein
MYVRFCERENFKVDILDYQSGEEAGIKSVTLFIKGKYARVETEPSKVLLPDGELFGTTPTEITVLTRLVRYFG